MPKLGSFVLALMLSVMVWPLPTAAFSCAGPGRNPANPFFTPLSGYTVLSGAVDSSSGKMAIGTQLRYDTPITRGQGVVIDLGLLSGDQLSQFSLGPMLPMAAYFTYQNPSDPLVRYGQIEIGVYHVMRFRSVTLSHVLLNQIE